jgi:SagB-type dehydrogenase family enzyme
MLCLTMVSAGALYEREKSQRMSQNEPQIIKLPVPRHTGAMSVEEALIKRRSVRIFQQGPILLAELSQLVWAAQGMTDQRGARTAPSAGALYPLELYVVAGNVEGLPAGIYKYVPGRHELLAVSKGDRRSDLWNVALRQSSLRSAALVLVLSGVYGRTTAKYGERGIRYVHMEAGHAAQNVYLQSAALRFGTVVVGAFHDEDVKKLFKMADGEMPLYIMPVGRLTAGGQ